MDEQLPKFSGGEVLKFPRLVSLSIRRWGMMRCLPSAHVLQRECHFFYDDAGVI